MYAIAQWLGRLGIGLLVVLVTAVLAGSAYETWARHRVAAEFPAPRILVDVGGGAFTLIVAARAHR